MAELFLELFGEEIPARMQAAAETRLRDAIMAGLAEAGLGGENAQSWSGPRRLAVAVSGIADREADIHEERRGPRADAPEQAVAGFLKSAGISRDEAEIRATPKGEFLFAVISRKGRPATDVLPELVSRIIAGFTWPKTMRWGVSRKGWVRPLHRITVLFDGQPLAGSVDLGGGMTIAFGNETEGHRVFADGLITLDGSAGYDAVLKAAAVIADRNDRKAMITEGLAALAAENSVTARDDQGLLEEVAGLVEYPRVIVGRIDDDFMDLPEEILVTSMRSHQKYFSFEDQSGRLAPYFATVSNMIADDARDAVIRAGNERVLRARLADARFFWEQDRATALETMVGNLSGIAFFEGLGSMGQKAERMAVLAEMLARDTGVDGAEARRAGLLAKADLISQTVGEFPEVQGIMGGYLARHANEPAAIADGIAEHYRPEGPGDVIPASETGRIVALADKIDTLVGFFGIGAVPTGSKDPFALRRAALGVIRIIAESGADIPLAPVFAAAATAHGFDKPPETLMPFFHDRLKVWLRDRGIRHDRVAAVIRDTDSRHDDLNHLCRLAETLDDFIGSDDGTALLAGYKRAANILAAEEKKDGRRFAADVDESLLGDDTEKALYDRITAIAASPVGDTEAAIKRMQSLGGLRAPIDSFFDHVTVNDDNPAIRLNRLGLLALIRATMEEIADFSAIEG
ncbi:MAG: glycine--tRNA ligase subunit beta [Candidatus Puniceispirillales bacterium]